ILAILAPHLPLAYLAARHAVGRARRGHVPSFSRRGEVARPLRRRRFDSPASAQAWFEWRPPGPPPPAPGALLLPFRLGPLFLPRSAPSVVFWTLVGVLLPPPVMAVFVAATVRKANVTSFLAARPLGSAAFVAAKLRVTFWSTLAAWLL